MEGDLHSISQKVGEDELGADVKGIGLSAARLPLTSPLPLSTAPEAPTIRLPIDTAPSLLPAAPLSWQDSKGTPQQSML